MPDPPTESTSNTANWVGTAGYDVYHVSFYTTVNNGTGAISVSCNGQTASVSYYYNYNPGCGDPGCANFDLPPGTYAWSTSTNKSGNITTGAVQCISIRL
jgi:hypothetical protein